MRGLELFDDPDNRAWTLERKLYRLRLVLIAEVYMFGMIKKIPLLVVAILFASGCSSQPEKRGGAGAPLHFTDFASITKSAAFSPKGDGTWSIGQVTFSGYYPEQLAGRYGYASRSESDRPSGIGQISQVSRIAAPGYIQSRELVSPGQNPNVMSIMSTANLGDFAAETAVVFYSGRARAYDDEADRERNVELRRRAGAGFVFRYQDAGNYYMVRTGGENGIEVGKMVNNQYTTLKFVPSERLENFLTPERSTVLRIAVRGSQIDTYVDNNLVARVNDSTFSIGQIGLMTFKVKAAFLYFSAWEEFGPNLPYF